MTPELDGMVEPEITINGTSLNFAQAMTIRVAIEHFAMWIAELPAKERTRVMKNYQAHIVEIRRICMEKDSVVWYSVPTWISEPRPKPNKPDQPRKK